jgi:hypothetical protein
MTLMIETDILHLNMAGSHIIILNSAKAATELLEKRSAVFSDRWEAQDCSYFFGIFIGKADLNLPWLNCEHFSKGPNYITANSSR